MIDTATHVAISLAIGLGAMTAIMILAAGALITNRYLKYRAWRRWKDSDEPMTDYVPERKRRPF